MNEEIQIEELTRLLDKASANLSLVLKSRQRAEDKIDRLEAENAELRERVKAEELAFIDYRIEEWRSVAGLNLPPRIESVMMPSLQDDLDE